MRSAAMRFTGLFAAFTVMAASLAAAPAAFARDSADTDTTTTTVTHSPQVETFDFSTAGSERGRMASSSDGTADDAADADVVTLDASATLPGDEGLSSVAVSWTQSATDAERAAPTVMLRYRDDGTWSDWTELPANIVDTGAETGADVSSVQATDPMYVGGADAVEASISFSENTGDAASLMPKLTVIDSGYALADDAGGDAPEGDDGQDDAQEETPRATLTPEIHTRESWWRSDLPARFWPVDDSGDWRGAIVHHTVDRNDYSESEVKAIVQNIYIFHTQTRGWGDIGYNLLVDRFGGIWEGRDEGVANAVKPASQAVGAHTSDFNYATFGVSVIGSFHLDDKPSEAAVQSVASAIAWEFNALDLVDVYGTFPYLGTQQRITGHGDDSHHVYGANNTLCPGVHLSDELPRIRTIVQSLLDATVPDGGVPVYRLYNPGSGLHHYTTDDNERETLVSRGWRDERVAFYAVEDGSVPVYRLYHPQDGNHLWTVDTNERDVLKNRGWKDERVGWKVDPRGEQPVYRLYMSRTGEHLYTTDFNEYQTLASSGWKQEGVAWQGL